MKSTIKAAGQIRSEYNQMQKERGLSISRCPKLQGQVLSLRRLRAWDCARYPGRLQWEHRWILFEKCAWYRSLQGESKQEMVLIHPPRAHYLNLPRYMPELVPSSSTNSQTNYWADFLLVYLSNWLIDQFSSLLDRPQFRDAIDWTVH